MKEKQDKQADDAIYDMLTSNQSKLLDSEENETVSSKSRVRKISSSRRGGDLMYDDMTWGTLSSKQWRELDAVSVQRLISRGWNPNSGNTHGSTVLHRMARKSSVEAIYALVACGARLSTLNGGKKTALDVATEVGDMRVVRALRSLASVKGQETPVIRAKRKMLDLLSKRQRENQKKR